MLDHDAAVGDAHDEVMRAFTPRGKKEDEGRGKEEACAKMKMRALTSWIDGRPLIRQREDVRSRVWLVVRTIDKSEVTEKITVQEYETTASAATNAQKQGRRIKKGKKEKWKGVVLKS